MVSTQPRYCTIRGRSPQGKRLDDMQCHTLPPIRGAGCRSPPPPPSNVRSRTLWSPPRASPLDGSALAWESAVRSEGERSAREWDDRLLKEQIAAMPSVDGAYSLSCLLYPCTDVILYRGLVTSLFHGDQLSSRVSQSRDDYTCGLFISVCVPSIF